MWFLKAFNLLKEIIRTADAPLANQKECEAYAEDAFRYCVSLYGQPADAKRPYRLFKGTGEQSACSYSFGCYTILISPDCTTLEQQCMTIGHEMYHRVTMRRNGLRKQVWVDELLALLTSLWFLPQHGFSEYADDVLEGYTSSPVKIDLRKLREYRRPPWYVNLKTLGPKYPENFYTEIARLATALKHIVSGNDICRIIKANTLAEWIASLPEEKQYAVCCILEVTSDGKKILKDNANLSNFRNALKAKGNRETAVIEFQKIAHLQPANGSVFFYLARAYEDAEDTDKALAAYLKAYALDFSDCCLPNNVGNIFWHKKEYAAAAEWFQRAADGKPDWAKSYYWLGRSLNNIGKVGEAHEAREKVLTLNDEEFINLAQKAMEENPLPDDIK